MRRGGLLLVAILAGALLPVAAPATGACAAEGPRAALVVETGDAVLEYCVALPDDSVSGIDLIVAASEQHGLSYRFGYGGNAVCMLADVGTTGDDCFERYPDFWGYWRGTSEGNWTWSSSGAHATVVEDGDVEGWAWGSGDGPSSHPAPPPTRFADVCHVTEEPSGDEGGKPAPRTGSQPNPQAPSEGFDPPPSDEVDGTEPAAAAAGDATEKPRDRRAGRGDEGSNERVGGRRSRSDYSERFGGAEQTAPDEPAPVAAASGDKGIPTGAMLSMGVVAAFVAWGAVLARRRKVA